MNAASRQISLGGRELVRSSIADNTRRAYGGALAALADWLGGRELTDAALADYLHDMFSAGRAPQTAAQVRSRPWSFAPRSPAPRPRSEP